MCWLDNDPNRKRIRSMPSDLGIPLTKPQRQALFMALAALGIVLLSVLATIQHRRRKAWGDFQPTRSPQAELVDLAGHRLDVGRLALRYPHALDLGLVGIIGVFPETRPQLALEVARLSVHLET